MASPRSSQISGGGNYSQQCRYHPRQHIAPHGTGQLAGRDRHESRVMLQYVPLRDRRDAGEKIRPHRQYRIDQRTGRPVRPGQLRCSQIRNSRIHRGAGAGRRCPGNYRQRDSAGLCQYRYGAGRAGGYSGKIIQRIPMGRLGQGQDIARGVLFLIADEADFVIGSTLSINGGQHMY